MEVHQHAHTPRKKWTHYFWEFLMLFLAVFCGFLAENEREHMIERKRAKAYAQNLVTDLERDTVMIRRIIKDIKKRVVVIDSFAAFIKGKDINQLRNLDLFILGSLDRYRPFMWNRSTMQQLINSGSLRYFSDAELINKISAYVAFTYHLDEDFQGDEERANSTANRRHELIDMNYPPDFIYGLRNNFDSVLKTDFYLELQRTDKTGLITPDINAIKILVNDRLNIRRNLYIRVEEELPRLVKDATIIIVMLKKKYHFEADQ